MYVFSFYFVTLIFWGKKVIYHDILTSNLRFLVFCLHNLWVKVPKQANYMWDRMAPKFSISLLYLAPQFMFLSLLLNFFSLCSFDSRSSPSSQKKKKIKKKKLLRSIFDSIERKRERELRTKKGRKKICERAKLQNEERKKIEACRTKKKGRGKNWSR